MFCERLFDPCADSPQPLVLHALNYQTPTLQCAAAPNVWLPLRAALAVLSVAICRIKGQTHKLFVVNFEYTTGLEWTGLTVGVKGTVKSHPGHVSGGMALAKRQRLIGPATVLVGLGIISEASYVRFIRPKNGSPWPDATLFEKKPLE